MLERAAHFARPDGSPGARALLRRHWGLLAVCAGFLLAGVLVLDDYGVGVDANEQIRIGNAALNYLSGDGERALDRLRYTHDR